MVNKYIKNVISHPKFYIVKFTKESNQPYLFFIHGGPGYNCGIVENLIEHHGLFGSLNYNIILYDQRTCGRSINFPDDVSHDENVNDLNAIYQYCDDFLKLQICGFIGHSYGAKLLFDYYGRFKSSLPGIFVAAARSLLTPRLNNLTSDLAYLKKVNVSRYNNILHKIEGSNLDEIWKLTEELAPLFQENKDRHYLYWANLDCFEQVQEIQKSINLPVNFKTFMGVRKDLYSDKRNFSIDIPSLDVPYLWINGFHDVVMNGAENYLSGNEHIITFCKSSHYPHLEENERFNCTVNTFISKEVY